MTQSTDQERAEFEAWANGRCELHLVNPAGRYSSAITQFAWEAWQARAALQAQPQETIGYVTRNEEGDPAMLFFDRNEARLYCEPGEEPEALVLAGPAPQAAVSVEHATLNLQPSSSMQPVATAFFTEQGEVAYTGIYDRTLKALEAVKTTRMGISCGSIDLYAHPQPAEPGNKTDWDMELSSWSDDDFVRVFHECPNLADRLRKMLAEPVKRKRPYAQGTALGEFGIIPMCDQVDDEPVKVPSDDLAHEIWAAAQTAPGEGIEDAVERIADLLAREAVLRDRVANSRPTEQEPFGYFKAGPFGWTDCAPTDEGAIPLYERAGMTDEDTLRIAREADAQIADLLKVIEDLERGAELLADENERLRAALEEAEAALEMALARILVRDPNHSVHATSEAVALESVRQALGKSQVDHFRDAAEMMDNDRLRL